MTPTASQFEEALQAVFIQSEQLGLVAIEVNSGNLHRRVGGYPGQDHRMPICCDVMYKAMTEFDEIKTKPEKGKGASLTVRYKIPRQIVKSSIQSKKHI